MIHYYKNNIKNISLPEKFTYPFNYTPHQLCITAAEEVKSYLHTITPYPKDIRAGKMFGVLVVKDKSSNLGYLAAYSGNINCEEIKSFFVPPVYDLLSPTSFFKEEEKKIIKINQQISLLESNEEFQKMKSQLEIMKLENKRIIEREKEILKTRKEERDKIRENNLVNEIDEKELIKESQFQKAEFKRLVKRLTDSENKLVNEINAIEKEILFLKDKRRKDSESLQKRIFSEFKFLNAIGEEMDLWSIFSSTPSKTPPAGAGECAAPKLLQYAFLHSLTPIAMAEFWLGDSPQNEVRHEGLFYPACMGKCKPILSHMLKGLNVEDNPASLKRGNELEILFEDEYLLAINKPSGMLSVSGKESNESVESLVRKLYPSLSAPFIVHRLDMATSGVMIIAKNKNIHKILQQKFISREVKKRYIAILDGTIDEKQGFIKLPLSPDYYDRPRQKVDFENGKIAITRYKVTNEFKRDNKMYSRIELYPITGRTHQLRVHCAHKDGLNTPILGDELYGRKDSRLFLHAQRIEFKHPVTQKNIIIEKQEKFWSNE